jgi:peptide/nickel transport system permease protein
METAIGAPFRPQVSVPCKMWRMLRVSKTGLLGVGLILIVTVAALFSPFVSPHDPLEQNIANRLAPPAWESGNWEHILGTDALGRDLLSRIIYGSRVSLLIGVSVTLMAGTLGVILGLVAGYFGGVWDTIIMRLADVRLAIPGMVLALVTLAVFGPGLRNVVIMLGLTGWVGYARIVRGQVLSTREMEFVDAARAVGSGHVRILFLHILPNVIASVVVVATLRVASTILVEASLSFLGLGVQPPTPTWGGMVADGLDLIYRAWWLSAFPGAAIFVTVLGMNLLGDWLRDALDPRLRA